LPQILLSFRVEQSLGLLSILALAGMYGLLLLAFRDRRHVAIVLVNLPLSLRAAGLDEESRRVWHRGRVFRASWGLASTEGLRT
jgi:hypothetical protein